MAHAPGFNTILQAAARLKQADQGEVLGALADKIQFLPEPARKAAFDACLRASCKLEEADRCLALLKLAHQIPELQVEDRVAAIDALLLAGVDPGRIDCLRVL